VGILRDLLGTRAGRRDDPAPAAVAAEVGHRVLVARRPAAVWQHLVSPAAEEELGVDCVRVLRVPGRSPDDLPEFVGVWRRPNGRVWAGLSTVVELQSGHRIVSRSSDGGHPLTLTTTLEDLDGGCVVSQQLSGALSRESLAFARAWLVRALLGLKADVEGTPRSVLADAESDDLVGRAMLGGLVGHGLSGAGGASFAPVSETATVEVAVPPEQVWAVLGAPSSEQLLKPTVEHLVRVELADDPGREHVVAVHRQDDGRRGGSVSLVVEASAPTRIVERDLTASHESDVVTTIEAHGAGSRLTETFTGWLPAGPGRVVDTSAIAAFMQTRLAAIKNLSEADVRPQRDPRTGFLPPVPPTDPADPRGPVNPAGPPDPPPTTPTSRPSVPSSTVLPPPHVPDPGAAYDPGPRFYFGDGVIYVADQGGWV
jgi:hypothetical protein